MAIRTFFSIEYLKPRYLNLNKTKEKNAKILRYLH